MARDVKGRLRLFCNDLVARDSHGTLRRFDGNCRGEFARPVKISGGWGKYQVLF